MPHRSDGLSAPLYPEWGALTRTLTRAQSRGLFQRVRSKIRRLAFTSGPFLFSALSYAAITSQPREQAKQLIDTLGQHAEHKQLIAEPIENAQSALTRAKDARAAGDERHATMLDELALEWASSAGDLVRAAELEKQASAVELKASAVEAKAVRAVAIIEEAVARKGRVLDQLQELQQSGRAAPASAPEQNR